MTNYERIRAMRVEGLAATLANEEEIVKGYCSSKHCKHYSDDGWQCSGQGESRCHAAVAHWLNSEAEGDDE